MFNMFLYNILGEESQKGSMNTCSIFIFLFIAFFGVFSPFLAVHIVDILGFTPFARFIGMVLLLIEILIILFLASRVVCFINQNMKHYFILALALLVIVVGVFVINVSIFMTL